MKLRQIALSAAVVSLFALGVPAAVLAQGQPASAALSPFQTKVKEAFDAIGRKDLDGAAARLNEAARLDPASPVPLVGLADVARLRGNPKESEAMLEKAVKLAPNNSDVLRAMARHQLSNKRVAEGEATYRRAIDADPKNVISVLELGDVYLNALRNPAKAADVYRQAIKVQPKHGGAHYGLGLALAAQGNAAEAAKSLDESIRLSPGNPLPLHARARLYLGAKQPEKALELLNRAINDKPEFLPARLDKGDVFLVMGRTDQAIAAYQEAVKAAPTVALANYKLGDAYHRSGKQAEAIAAYRKTVELDARFVPAYNNLAWLSAERKENLNDALTWARKAVELQPQAGPFLDTLGFVHRTRGEQDAAIAAFEKAVATKPPAAEYHYHLGQALADKGRSKDAVAAFRKALEINPKFAGAADAQNQIQRLGS